MSPLVTFQLECVFICSANPGGNYTASGTGNPQYHHARPPPSPRQVPFSYCQRPFGLKTTTRSCHTTSHPAGHSIQRHLERLVAGGGIEPPSEAYETSELPLLYPAIVWCSVGESNPSLPA